MFASVSRSLLSKQVMTNRKCQNVAADVNTNTHGEQLPGGTLFSPCQEEAHTVSKPSEKQFPQSFGGYKQEVVNCLQVLFAMSPCGDCQEVLWHQR